MPKVFRIVLVFALAACGPGAASSSLAPVPTSAPSQNTGSPGPSGACIDRSLLADTADSAHTSFQRITAALKENKSAEASDVAATAATQMRKLADLVEALRPAAAAVLRDGADKLDAAKANLGDLSGAAPAVETLFGQAYDLAMAGACPA